MGSDSHSGLFRNFAIGKIFSLWKTLRREWNDHHRWREKGCVPGVVARCRQHGVPEAEDGEFLKKEKRAGRRDGEKKKRDSAGRRGGEITVV